MSSALRTVLQQIRQATFTTSQADKGGRFEILIKRFLETEPTYRERFSQVWLWNDWPWRGQRHDIGIDLIAREAATDMLDPGLEEREGDYIRHDGITDYALKQFRVIYNDRRTCKEDIFYYIYGLLHSPEYRTRFANDLKKELPRIPFSRHFREFSAAGRELAQWHLHYETIEPYPVTEERIGENYRVSKMRFPKKGEKSTIIYNDTIPSATSPWRPTIISSMDVPPSNGS